jgi:hypothetical protein
MRSMFRAGLTAGLLVAAGVAVAADFQPIGRSGKGSILIDVDSVKVRSGHLTAWYLIDYGTRQKSGELSAKFQSRIDCDAETHGITTNVSYKDAGGSGEVLNSTTIPSYRIEMEPAIPETIGEEIVGAACHVQRHGSLAGYFEEELTPEQKAEVDASVAAAVKAANEAAEAAARAVEAAAADTGDTPVDVDLAVDQAARVADCQAARADQADAKTSADRGAAEVNVAAYCD